MKNKHVVNDACERAIGVMKPLVGIFKKEERGEVLEPEESNVENIEDNIITESENSHNNSDLAEPSLVDVLEV